LVAIAHMAWTVLKEDIPLDAVAAFVVPILLVGATFLVPWGLVLRRMSRPTSLNSINIIGAP